MCGLPSPQPITIEGKFSVLVIDELAGGTWFTSLDLRAGFIRCAWNRAKSIRRPSKLISDILILLDWSSWHISERYEHYSGALFTTVRLGLLDDIIVYSPSFETHLQHLRLVLQLLVRDRGNSSSRSVDLLSNRSLFSITSSVQQAWVLTLQR